MIINVIAGWFDGSVSVPLRLTYLLDYILWIAKAVVMVMLGFKALKLGSVAVGRLIRL